MITQESAMLIWDAYREISAAEKLLNDISEHKKWELDGYAPSLKDAVIRAHMAHAKAKLADANERARIELSTSPPDL